MVEENILIYSIEKIIKIKIFDSTFLTYKNVQNNIQDFYIFKTIIQLLAVLKTNYLAYDLLIESIRN